ncbi:MAG: thioredoxin [Saprospiraceae bacterium]|nr:thioredoxin [Saprospiraceae bacterium]
MPEKKSFNDIINQEVPVLVDFTAAWCGPCQMMAPVLSELAKEMGGNARIVKVDIDRNRKLAEKLKIRGVPTFIIYKEGKPVWRESGMQSLYALKTQLEAAN